LKITDGEGLKRFTIFRSEQVDDAQKKLHVIAFMNQRLMFQATANLVAKTSASGTFPTKDLPSGILQVTIFDNNYKPVAERITFINNHDYEFDGDAFFAQKSFAHRGMNAIEISTTDT